MITVGRYQLVEKLGQGGMGVVYRAYDTLLQRTVAVKIILGMIEPGSEQRERFFREARAAGQLSHRNIITIHDLGEHDGQPYLAMEYLEGEDLQRRLSRTIPLTLGEKLDLAMQVAEGLDYAHARGVIHRDIKPANIFITNQGTAKILDFGLARLMTSELTHSKFMMGTINYMAPEQVMGERADHRADIFAFGVVLYELLCGKKAFDGDSAASTLYKIVESSPQPLLEVDSSLPPQVVAIAEHALAKNRDGRYQRMADLLRDLEEVRRELLGPDAPGLSKTGSGSHGRSHLAARPESPSSPLTPQSGPADETGYVPQPTPVPLSKPSSGGRPASGPSAPPSDAPAPAPSRSWLVPAVATLLIAALALGVWMWQSRGGDAVTPSASSAGAGAPVDRTAVLAAIGRAKDAIEAGDLQAAGEHVAEAKRLAPDDSEVVQVEQQVAILQGRVDDAVREAQEHFAAGRFAEASRAAGTAIALAPSHAEARKLMADATARLQGRGAEDARRRMNEAKAAARAASAQTLVPAAYNAAIGAEQRAERALQSGDLDTATARFYEASGLFRSAEVSARSEAAARSDRAEAERAEKERLAKEQADRERAERERAEQEQAERDRLAKLAAKPVEAVPTPPPPIPPPAKPAPEPPAKPAPPEPSAESLIAELLNRYEAALEARSLANLRRLWPTLTGAQEAALRDEFQHASRIEVGISSPRIEVTGGTATATFIRDYNIVTIDGQRHASQSLATMTCRRTAAGWVIEQVRFELR